MASITELVNSFDVNSKEFESLVHDLMINNSDVPFDDQEIDVVQNTIITSINSRINEANTRYDGLLILDRILFRCSKDTLSKYGLLWITKATRILENVNSTVRELTLACKVLGFLVEHCKKIPELHKQISMQNVKQLVNVLNSLHTDVKCGAVYYLMAVLLYHYPEVCERFQGLIKKMILLQIDSTQENLINASAKCYVLLGQATMRSFKPPPAKSIYTGWTYNEALLCNNLHAIMDELFSGLIELETVDIWDQLELRAISEEDVIQYYNGQKQRFSNLCVYLSSMLRGYEAQNSVVPRDILRVLCRGLAITPLNLKNKSSFKEQMLYIILPKLHISLLTVLDAFINGFAQELISFGGTILQLFQQTLRWTSTVLKNEITFSNSRPFKSVKLCTYKCLSSWLMNTSTLSGIETIANECISFILKDIVPQRDRILLTVQKKQRFSKRLMKRFKDSQYENSTVLNNKEASTKSKCLDADLCKEALIVLQNILFSGGILLKKTFYENVQNTVIPLLYRFYLGSSDQSFYEDHSNCRLELFKVLKALQMNPHITLASPTQYSLEISRMAAYDVDLSIAQEAKLALAELEKIIHPAAPTLQLPRQEESDDEFLENQSEETTTSKSDKRNRVEQELSQDTDMIPPVCKQPKILQDTEKQCEKSASKCMKTVQHGNSTKRKNIEPIEVSDDVIDLDKSHQTDDDLCENVLQKTGDVLQERSEMHCNKEQTSSNIDGITNGDTESRVECKAITHVITEDQEQYEEPKDSMSYRRQSSETEESSSEIAEVQKNVTQNDWEEQGELDSDELESLNLFHDEVKLNY